MAAAAIRVPLLRSIATSVVPKSLLDGPIGELYLREREWDTASVGPARAALRQEHFARPLRWPRRLAIGLRTRHLPRSLIGKACAYLLDNPERRRPNLRWTRTRRRAPGPSF